MLLNAIHTFWKKNPALLYALSMLYGFYYATVPCINLTLPVIVTFMPWVKQSQNKRYILAFLLLLACYFYASNHHRLPALTKPVEGVCDFQIEAITTSRTLFAKKWIYKGNIVSFRESESSLEIGKNIPAIITLHQKKSLARPPANCDYSIKGSLVQTGAASYVFIPDRGEAWLPIKNSKSLAERRFELKQTIAKWIQNKIKDANCGQLLSGLATGCFEDRSLYIEFSRYGLQHIMAISGFHFSIIAAILSMVLRFVFPLRTTYWILAAALSTYFVFLGNTPSILRAWIMIMVGLFGFLFEKRENSLNSLGVAMCVILSMNPLACVNLGFQLSVIITAAILIFYPLCTLLLEKLSPKRKLSIVLKMNTNDKCIYLIVSFLKKAAAILFAVNIIAFPLTLHYFNKFPLLSLIYNLFIPFLVSISMLFLILSVVLYPFHAFLDSVNNLFTKTTLNFIYHMPLSLDYSVRSQNISSSLLVIYLTLFFLLAVAIRQQFTPDRLTKDEWTFL